MKYVKKPIQVEAFEFGKDKEPKWFINYDKKGNVKRIVQSGNAVNPNFYSYEVQIFNDNNEDRFNVCTAYHGDMIIKEITGNRSFKIYSSKKDIFDATYELVT